MKTILKHRWILAASLTAWPASTPRDLPAQSFADRNLLGGEVLGRAMVYSINYERMLGERFGAGAGVGFWGNSEDNLALVPLYVSSTPVGRRHALYVAAGATIGTSNIPLFKDSIQREGFAFGTATAGYQFRSSRYIIRPVIHFLYGRNSSILWPGVTKAPEVEVHIVPSIETPGGIREPSTAMAAGPRVNAVSAVTGRRIYKLPIRAEQLRR